MAEKKELYKFEGNEHFEWHGEIYRKIPSKREAGLAMNVNTGEEVRIPSMTLVAPFDIKELERGKKKTKKQSFPVDDSDEALQTEKPLDADLGLE